MKRKSADTKDAKLNGKAKTTHGKRNAAKKLPSKVAAIGIEGALPQAHEARPGPGRPLEYRREFAAVARGMAKMGATDFEIAEELGVVTSTLWLWRSKFREFSNSLLEGKHAFDDRAERSLAMKAIGYTYHSEKIFCHEGEVIRVPIVEHVPPDVGAIKMWLGNRRPEKWKEKAELKLSPDEAFLEMLKIVSEGGLRSEGGARK